MADREPDQKADYHTQNESFCMQVDVVTQKFSADFLGVGVGGGWGGGGEGKSAVGEPSGLAQF